MQYVLSKFSETDTLPCSYHGTEWKKRYGGDNSLKKGSLKSAGSKEVQTDMYGSPKKPMMPDTEAV